MKRQPNTRFQETALLALRAVIAAIFLYSTWAKWAFLSSGAPGLPAFMVGLTWFLTIVEPLGALALIAGFLTRWAAMGLALIMVGAVLMLRVTMHTALFTGPTGVGLDYNLLILACCLALAAFGAGRWSLDALRARRR